MQVFQCLLVGGENEGEDALRNAQKLVVSDQQFDAFLQRHADIAYLVPESNAQVKSLTFSID